MGFWSGLLIVLALDVMTTFFTAVAFESTMYKDIPFAVFPGIITLYIVIYLAVRCACRDLFFREDESGGGSRRDNGDDKSEDTSDTQPKDEPAQRPRSMGFPPHHPPV